MGMDPADPTAPPRLSPRPKPWVVFLGAVAVMAAILGVANQPDREPGTRPRAAGASSGGSASVRAQFDPEFSKALTSSQSWQRTAALFVDRLQGDVPQRWAVPSAGRPVPPEILALQEQASSIAFPAVQLRFNGLGGGPVTSAGFSKLEIGSSDQVFAFDLDNLGPVDLALPPEAAAISIRLYNTGFLGFFGAQQSGRVSVPRQALLAGGRTDVSIPWSSRQGDAPLPVGIESTVLPRVDRGSPKSRSPKELRSTEFNKSLYQTGQLGPLSPDDDFLIDNADRYTAILVVADTALRDRVRCFRLDTGQQIGAYNPDVYILAAMAHNRAPLLVRIGGPMRGRFSYQVFAISRDTEPGADLALWFLGGHLMETKFDGLPVSNEQARAVAAWLADSFGIRFTREDLDKIKDANARAVAATMLQPLPQAEKAGPR